ncbi:hypothetical protein CBR_g37824 [Chara braunii]|uniref:Uncharacterized protein n=1 Tax=Chara braunii TaxID=69332 RepID=A0A388LP12_CHABU|nr:hypothetical protein CBR_g37824 [Chara braunii]|eukprot:GBG83952.1 hypothetical protein CBR_g37824 [Chara braunii]
MSCWLFSADYRWRKGRAMGKVVGFYAENNRRAMFAGAGCIRKLLLSVMISTFVRERSKLNLNGRKYPCINCLFVKGEGGDSPRSSPNYGKDNENGSRTHDFPQGILSRSSPNYRKDHENGHTISRWV